jgi:hypothetical protein
MTNGVWKNQEYFEACDRGGSVEFDMNKDGGCWVSVDTRDGKETFTMTPEQFAAFKEWVAATGEKA